MKIWVKTKSSCTCWLFISPVNHGTKSMDSEFYDVTVAPLLMKLFVDDTGRHSKLSCPTNNSPLTFFDGYPHHLKR